MVLSHLFLHCNLEDSKNTRATRGLVDNYLQIAAAAMEVPQETQMQVVCFRAKGDQAAGKRHANTIKSARSSNRVALGELLQRAMANLTTDMMRLAAHVNKRLDVLEATVAAQGARIAALEADVGVLKDERADPGAADSHRGEPPDSPVSAKGGRGLRRIMGHLIGWPVLSLTRAHFSHL